MKRLSIMGLCLAAVFAFSAMVASGAQAAEYGQCLKINPANGKPLKNTQYKDANCTVKESASDPDGKYEWYPGPPKTCFGAKNGHYKDSACTVGEKESDPDGKFTGECGSGPGSGGIFGPPNNCAAISATGSTAFLENEGHTIKIECATNGSEKGEILSATKADGVAVYTGCKDETAGAITCHSAGAAAGEIKTNELEATPEEFSGKVYVNYTNSSNTGHPYLAEFECGANVATFRVKGAAAGLYATQNEMNTTSTQTFNGTIGHQSLELEVKTGAGSFGSPEKSLQNQVTTFTTPDPLGAEINT
jgi:hypothetical protein